MNHQNGLRLGPPNIADGQCHHDLSLNRRTNTFLILCDYDRAHAREYDLDGRLVWAMPSPEPRPSHFNTMVWDYWNDRIVMHDLTNRKVWIIKKSTATVLHVIRVPHVLHDVHILDDKGNFAAYVNHHSSAGMMFFCFDEEGHIRISGRWTAASLGFRYLYGGFAGYFNIYPLNEIDLIGCPSYKKYCELLQVSRGLTPFARKIPLGPQGRYVNDVETLFLHRMRSAYAAPPLLVTGIFPGESLCLALWSCTFENQHVSGSLKWAWAGNNTEHQDGLHVALLPFWQKNHLCITFLDFPASSLVLTWTAPHCLSSTLTTVPPDYEADVLSPVLHVGTSRCLDSFCVSL